MPEEKPKPCPKGDGGLRWSESRQRWIAEITVGYAPAGKRFVRTASDKSKAKALKSCVTVTTDCRARDIRCTVRHAIQVWLEHGLSNRDEDTVIKCRSLADNHITPFLGARKLRELSADDVDVWLAGRAKVLSTDTLRQLRPILKRAITHAQKRDKVKRNVVLLCDVPRGKEGRPSKALSIEQVSSIVQVPVGTLMYAYIVLSLLTGIRIEELRALCWSHMIAFDAERNEWVPVKQAGWEHEQFAVYVWWSVRAGGKTKKSRRSLALPKRCAEALRFQMELQSDSLRQRGRSGRRTIWSSPRLWACRGTPTTSSARSCARCPAWWRRSGRRASCGIASCRSCRPPEYPLRPSPSWSATRPPRSLKTCTDTRSCLRSWRARRAWTRSSRPHRNTCSQALTRGPVRMTGRGL